MAASNRLLAQFNLEGIPGGSGARFVRLVARNFGPLPDWHPLISGDPASVHRAGISVRYDAVLRFICTYELPVARMVGARRYLDDAGDALEEHLRASPMSLHDPFLLPDMQRAAERAAR